MIVKNKHIQVIFYSSAIIVTVLTATLLIYNVYLQWKNDSFALKYENSVYQLTAEIFGNDILIANADVQKAEDDFADNILLFQGSIRNNTGKTISSLLIEVVFLDPAGTILHKEWVYPLGKKSDLEPLLFGARGKERALAPEETTSFRHFMRNCPRKILNRFAAKKKFAKKDLAGEMRLDYSIAGMSVL